MKVEFDKNVFEPDDDAKAKVVLDNSGCQLNMTSVDMYIEQRITQKADGHTNFEKHILVKKSAEGVPALHHEKVEREVELDLSKIKNTMKKQHKKKGKMKDVSPEDFFLGSNMQAVCTSPLFNCQYFLVVKCSFDGCICCSDIPDSQIPISINPKSADWMGKKELPSGFNPKMEECYSISL